MNSSFVLLPTPQFPIFARFARLTRPRLVGRRVNTNAPSKFSGRVFSAPRFSPSPSLPSRKTSPPTRGDLLKTTSTGEGWRLGFCREGRRTEDAMQSRKKKTMKTNRQKSNEGAREQIRNIEQTNTSTVRQAVENTVAKLSTPTGGDTSKQEAAEAVARAERKDTTVRVSEQRDLGQPSSGGLGKPHRLPIDSEARKQNRTLPTPKVLSALHQQLPAAYRLAEVVGRWVWVTFKEQPAAEIRQQLAQLGFHWNRERQAWQHPCGKFSLGSQQDPHEKYSSYRPASVRRSAKQQPAEAVAA